MVGAADGCTGRTKAATTHTPFVSNGALSINGNFAFAAISFVFFFALVVPCSDRRVEATVDRNQGILTTATIMHAGPSIFMALKHLWNRCLITAGHEQTGWVTAYT